MNNLLAPMYELFFDYASYQDLLDMIYNNYDYGKIGLVLLLVPLALLAVFYKVWEPMRKQRLMWFLSLLLILIITYLSTTVIINNNGEILEYIGNYTGDDGQMDPDYFIFQMSMISVLYSLVLSIIYSLGLKTISVNNSHNPF